MADSNTPEMVNWAQFFPSEDGKLGAYLAKSGRPINCRLDFRLTRLEELKKAAQVVSELNKMLQKFAYEVEGDPVLRVMIARTHFAKAQFELRYVNPETKLRTVARQTLESAKKLKKTRKDKKLPIVLGDILGFGNDTSKP
jgi:hypothetical protein